MKNEKNIWTASLLVAGTSLLALGMAAPAIAQQSEPVTLNSEAEDTEAVQQTVVITGSRIARRELATPAPIVTLGADDLVQSGEVDIANVLREIPALLLSDNANQSLVNGGAQGASLLNLRGLGTNRTLVLQNGRRHVSGIDGDSAVDVSTIPAALIERVEVLTGSASSIYGADAVTGVVNFVLNDNFDGLDSRGQVSISDQGDGEEYFLSVTAGKNFLNDRANIYASVDYTRTTSIAGTDRPGLGGSTLLQFVDATDALAAAAGAPAGTEQVLASDVRFPFSAAGGAIDIFGTGLATQFFDATTGAIRPFDFGTPTNNAFEVIGGDGILLSTDRDFLIPEIDRVNVNVGGKFEVNQYLNFFVEGKYARSDSNEVAGVNGFNDFIPIAADNAFIPDALTALIATDPDAASAEIVISRDVLDDTTAPFNNALRETFRGVIGFEGELNNGWNYEASFNYGRTDTVITNERDRIDDRLFAGSDSIALDAAGVTSFNAAGGAAQALRAGALISLNGDAQAGDIVCRSEFEADTGAPISPIPVPAFPTPVFAGQIASFAAGDGQCVPINLFGENVIGIDAANFAFIPSFTTTDIEQIVAGFTLSGDSSEYFELPAGPIGFATGFEYRDESSNFQPASVDAAGVTFSASSGTAQVPTIGSFDTTEAFAEVSIPLIKDYAPFNELTLDASIRYANNSSAGVNNTWGLGLLWEVVPSLRFRGSYGESVRAPNIFELFSPASPATLGAAADPCNPAFIGQGPIGGIRQQNCLALVGPGFVSSNTAFVSGTSGGNPNLNPEDAVTYTAGVVLQPTFLPGFTLTVDYYDIEIQGAIASLAAFTIAENCVDAVSIDNAFCDQIFRGPDGSITGFTSGQQNIGALETNGVDFSASYNADLEDLLNLPYGEISLSVTGTRLIQDRVFADQNDFDTENPNEFEVGRPRLNIVGNANWSYSNFNVGWQTRYQTSQFLINQTDVNSVRQSSFPVRTGDSFVHDLNVSYDFEAFGKDQSVYAGINNIADRDPFVTLQTLPVSALGRTFFVGFQARF
jgi:outer membrane receptor protein involved in Fe transport